AQRHGPRCIHLIAVRRARSAARRDSSRQEPAICRDPSRCMLEPTARKGLVRSTIARARARVHETAMLSRRSFLQLAGLGSAGLILPRGGKSPSIEPLPDDPMKAWWLRKDFAPIGESMSANLDIEGALPPELSGLYVRNGPNPIRG